MATNKILKFAELDTTANLLTDAEYSADTQRIVGNQPGVARSKLVNKVMRQTSTIAAGIAEYLAANQPNDVSDALTPAQIADMLSFATTKFKQDGTGAVTRTVQDKLREFVSVKDFGAVGDGVADDTAAFNLANGSSAGAIYVSEGVYILDGATIIGKLLFGPGTLKWKAGVPGTTPMLTLAGGASVEGLTFDGNKIVNAAITGLTNSMVVVSGRGTTVRGCKFIQSPSTVILTPASADGEVASDGLVEGCLFKNTNKYCVIIRSNRWKVASCTFFGTGINEGHAVRFGVFSVDVQAFPTAVVDGGVVNGCVFKYVNSTAVLVELRSKSIVITGNYISFCSGTIKVEKVAGEEGDGCVFSGNWTEYTKNVIAYNETTETAALTGTFNSLASVAGFKCTVNSNVFFESQGLSVGNNTVVASNQFINSGTTHNNSLIKGIGNGCVISGNLFSMDGVTALTNIIEFADFGNNHIIDNVFENCSAVTRVLRLARSNDVVKGNTFKNASVGVGMVSTCTDTAVAENYFIGVTTPIAANTNTVTHAILNNYSNGTTAVDYRPITPIVSDAITVGPNNTRVLVDTEGGASTDDLVTINGGRIGQILSIFQIVNSRDVTVRSTGNIRLTAAGDFNIDTTTASITLMFNGTNWAEIGRAS